MVYRPLWSKVSSWQFMVLLHPALGSFNDRWNPLNPVPSAPEKKPGPGRPVISVTQETIGEIGNGRNCLLSCYCLNFDKYAVYRVLTDFLGPRNMCFVWIPHKLSDQNKVQWVECANLVLGPFASHPLHSLRPTIASRMNHRWLG